MKQVRRIRQMILILTRTSLEIYRCIMAVLRYLPFRHSYHGMRAILLRKIVPKLSRIADRMQTLYQEMAMIWYIL